MRTVLTLLSNAVLVSFTALAMTALAADTTPPSMLIGKNAYATITHVAARELHVDRHDGGVDFTLPIGSVGYRASKTTLPDGAVQRTSHLTRFYLGFLTDATSGKLYAVVERTTDGAIVRVPVSRSLFTIMALPLEDVTGQTVPGHILNLIPLAGEGEG